MNIQPLVTAGVKASIVSRIGNGNGFKKTGLKPQRGRVNPRQNARQTVPIRGGARRGRGARMIQRNPRYNQVLFIQVFISISLELEKEKPLLLQSWMLILMHIQIK